MSDLSKVSTVTDILKSSLSFLEPPEHLEPDEWAERNIIIPKGNALPGPLRFDNAPYQREPLNIMAGDGEANMVTLMWGAQTGKTNLINMAIGYHIDHKTNSVIMMQPSKNDVSTWASTKFEPMLNSCKSLSKKISKPRDRDGVNNQTMKSFPGGFLMLTWAGSPKTARSRSAPTVINDEVDGSEVTSEGHPVDLLAERCKTFGDNRLHILASTPTDKETSYIERSFSDGDQREFYVPCPDCEHEQILKWGGIKWDKSDEGEHLPETAYYVCEECGSCINEKHKVSMVRQGRWIAKNPFKGHASFHLNELVSLMSSWQSIVEKFLRQKKKGDLKTFFNTALAETWEEYSEEISPDTLIQRVEEYKAEVPAGVGVLTAAVDVQDDRIELSVKGWGKNYENWLIDYKVFYGEYDTPEDDPKSPWYKLNRFREHIFMHENGHQMRIESMFVDSSAGNHTQHVYAYCIDKRSDNVFPIKGRAGFKRQLLSPPTEQRVSAKSNRKVKLFTIGVDIAKQLVHKRLAIKEVGPSYCHFNTDTPPSYFDMVTAEKLFTKFVQGFPTKYWKKVRQRNEALDVEGYNEAALHLLQVNLDDRVNDLQLTVEAHKEKMTPKPRQVTKRRRVVRRRRR